MIRTIVETAIELTVAALVVALVYVSAIAMGG